MYQSSVQLRIWAFQGQPVSDFHAASNISPVTNECAMRLVINMSFMSSYQLHALVFQSRSIQDSCDLHHSISSADAVACSGITAPGEWDACRCMDPVSDLTLVCLGLPNPELFVGITVLFVMFTTLRWCCRPALCH